MPPITHTEWLALQEAAGGGDGVLTADVLVTNAEIKALLSPEAVRAQAKINLIDQPVETESFTLGSIVYAFAASLSAPGEIAVGGDLATTKANIIAAINGTDGTNTPNASATAAGAFVGGSLTLTAIAYGAVGNDIPTADDGSSIFYSQAFGVTTLGVDATRAPRTLIAAPGADLVLTILSVRLLLDARAGAYTTPVSGLSLALGFGESLIGDAENIGFEIAGVGAARDDLVVTDLELYGAYLGSLSLADRLNQPFTLLNAGQLNYVGGHANSGLRVQIQYRADPAVLS